MFRFKKLINLTCCILLGNEILAPRRNLRRYFIAKNLHLQRDSRGSDRISIPSPIKTSIYRGKQEIRGYKKLRAPVNNRNSTDKHLHRLKRDTPRSICLQEKYLNIVVYLLEFHLQRTPLPPSLPPLVYSPETRRQTFQTDINIFPSGRIVGQQSLAGQKKGEEGSARHCPGN